MAKKIREVKEEKKDYGKLRSSAEDLYIYSGMNGREIAELFMIPEQTISRWKKGRDGEKNWDDRKSEMQLTPLRVKELLIKEAEKVAKGEETKIEADKLSKIIAAIDRLDKKVNVRIIMDIFKEFDNYMADIDPAKAIEFTKYHKLFLQHRISLEA